MKDTVTLMFSGRFFGIFVVLFCWLSASPTPAVAQGVQGQDAVYTSSNVTVGSYAFIDASTFKGSATDICGVLKFVLATVDQPPNYPSGAVIDARGLNSGNTSMTCTTANPSPWAGIASPPPSIILLPSVIPDAYLHCFESKH
jgi:hypothetical protein